MGYGCTIIAARVRDAMLNVLKHDGGEGWDICSRCSNGWATPKGGFFYEESRRDQQDDGLCGRVFRADGRVVGSVKVDGGGHVVRWPTSSRKQRQRAQVAGFASFYADYGAVADRNVDLVQNEAK